MNNVKRTLALLCLVACSAAGCNSGNDIIPLAKVDPPKNAPPPSAKAPKAPAGVPVSPTELIYK